MLLSPGDLGDLGDRETEERRWDFVTLGDRGEAGDFGDLEAFSGFPRTFSLPLRGDFGLMLW